jgi:hypothetical protein
MLQGNQAK